jgi:hypothetical protein
MLQIVRTKVGTNLYKINIPERVAEALQIILSDTFYQNHLAIGIPQT